MASASTDGAAFPWILEHLLTYPGTYEIPLRTMYTLNATTQSQQPGNASSPNQIAGNAFPSRPVNPEEGQALNTQTAAAQLRANLLSHISQQPSQPASLPPSFVTSFVRRCFPVELDSVDFPQALTALDYLKDLEIRRRREVVAALARLGVSKDDFSEKEKMGKKYPGVLRWIVDIEDKERKVEQLYTQVYLGLRRWTLINEMSLQPFNKSNCLAMLNTLYPPTNNVQPTAQLTSPVLTAQRNGFFRYIQNVEKTGPGLLKTLIDQGKHPNQETGWTNVRDTVDRYLRAANSIIDECHEIIGRGDLASPVATEKEAEEQRSRKVDSGISFASSNRLSKHRVSSSTSSATSSIKSKEKTMPPRTTVAEERPSKPTGSTLERIAREIRKIGSRSDIGGIARRERSKSCPRGPENDTNMTDDEPPPMPHKEKKIRLRPSLKKMRSITTLGERDRNISSAGNSIVGRVNEEPTTPSFDVDEMRQRRMLYEANKARESKTGQRGHDYSIDSMEVDG